MASLGAEDNEQQSALAPEMEEKRKEKEKERKGTSPVVA